MIRLSKNINPNKVFLINRSELEGKLEVGYYSPEINQIEKQIRSKSIKRLRDFIIRISSGATPSVQDEAKFYSDEKNGIPFLRVQNLCTNGKLDLSNVRYINKETHENYLKRSQVSGGDLLIKITGVGRMAIASVAPDGFVGNTNQHMVVIKTKSREISEYLANYLNLDIIEKIASRKATGATRPALDYAALKSIPIVEGLDFSLLTEAEIKKERKEAEAKALLESIDTYILKELGISLPVKNHTLKERIFTAKFSEVVGGRYDPQFLSPIYTDIIEHVKSGNFDRLKNIISFSNETWNQIDEFDETFPYIEISEINLDNGEIKNINWLPISEAPSRAKMMVREGDIIVSTTRPDRGAISLISKMNDKNIASTGFAILRNLKRDDIYKKYLYYVLRSQICLLQIQQRTSGGNYPAITTEELKNIYFPIVSIEKQKEIAEHIDNIYNQISRLLFDAASIVEEAKKKVEQMIIGKY